MSPLFPEKVVFKVGPTEILVGEKRVACDPAYGADPWSGALAALAAHKPEAPCRVTVVLANPLVSVRSYDADQLCLYDLGQVCAGAEVEAPLMRALSDPRTRFVNIHTARPGCWLAGAERL